MPEPTALLEARHLHKRFHGVHALNDVSASFYEGEVAAVMGENGAGKSTLMKALAGVHTPDEGQILWRGKPVQINSVRDASALGIAFIHQELNLAENLSVGANVFLGREPSRFGLIDQRSIKVQTEAILQSLGLTFSADTLVEDLSIGHRQMVEIAKALSQEARLLIMDEPTSSLSAQESEKLFVLVRQLCARGIGIVFISHRMSEVQGLADRVTVLRDGQNSGFLEKHEITKDRIVSLMVGRHLVVPEKTGNEPGRPLLTLKDLRTQRFPQHPVNLTLRAGEIVGVAGLVGAGRTEVLRRVFGIDAGPSTGSGGTIEVDSRLTAITRPQDAIQAGLALVPEDRKAQGIILDMAIRDNVVLSNLSDYQLLGFARDGAISTAAHEQKTDLNIKTPFLSKAVGQLSGGNQQKVAIAKWLVMKPRVFLLDEPTRGVDVGAKSEIYAIIERMAQEGSAVLFVSSDLEEILRISDRVIVMHEGRITGELSRSQLSEQSIMSLATGSSSESDGR